MSGKFGTTARGGVVSLFALSISIASVGAIAQTADVAGNAGQAVAAPDEGEAIIVTGSRIRRTSFDTPNPVVTISAETIQESGTTNLTDFLTQYPALIGSSTSNSNAGQNASIGFTGLNLLNLRNLGIDRTLVLIDGRRSVSSVPGSAAVDVNTIPSELVDRVEILTGGASAVYGADGVTGVVNFIMKKDFEGLTGRAQAGISEHGDAGQRLISVTAGKNFADGRGNIALSYEYASESRLESRDRKRLTGDGRTGFFLNPDDPENQPGYAGSNSNGIPDNIPLDNIRYFDTARQGGIDVDFDGFPDYYVGNGGAVTPFEHGSFVPNFYEQGGSGTRVSDYANDLLPSVKRQLFNAIGHFEVSPALTIFAEGKYARIRTFSLSQPTFDYYLPIAPDNAYLPDELKDTVAANGGALLNRDNFDLGQRGEDILRETYRSVIGAKGDLGSHLNYEVSYVYGQTKTTNHYINDRVTDRFQSALDAVDQGAYLTGTPNGNIVCRAAVDPVAAAGAITFNPTDCVPLNLFGEGVASQAALNFIHADTTDRSKVTQQVVSANLSGDFGAFFSLPGGPVSFSLGAEYRKETSSFVPDELSTQGLTYGNILSADHGKYDVKEIFGELDIPVLKNQPFFYSLDFGGALRFSHYSTVGHTTTWNLKGSWAPVRDITFNGTYSHAVRAPNISELFSGQSQTFLSITDPCNVNEIQNGTQYRAANCQSLLSSLGADPATYVDTRSATLPGSLAGNPDLQEETAKTWTAGVVLEPRFIPGLSIRADWYNIDLTNAINTVDPESLAQLCVDQPTLDNQYCGGITRQSGTTGEADAGNITDFLVTPQNVASFKTAGLDLDVSYRLRTQSAGMFLLKVNANYLDKLTTIDSPGAPLVDHRGESSRTGGAGYLSPKYTVNADLTWSLGKVTLNYGLSWYDKTTRFTNQEIAGNPDIVAPEYFYIKERWQHDVYGAIDVNERFQFYAGVNNLFDQKPALGLSSFPVSSVGRYVYAGVRVKTAPFF